MKIEKYSPKWLLEKINNSKNDAHKLMHIIEYSKEIIKSTDQQLILSGVSQQRELLNSFAEAWNVSMIKKEYILDSDIDRFIEIKTI